LRIIAACLVLPVFALCLPSQTSFDGLAFVNRDARAKVPCVRRGAAELIANASASIVMAGGGTSAAELAKLQQQVCLSVVTSAMRGSATNPRAAGIGANRTYAKVIGSLWSDRSRDPEL
jgi:hypothetical protein